jgi:hypothetical protein
MWEERRKESAIGAKLTIVSGTYSNVRLFEISCRSESTRTTTIPTHSREGGVAQRTLLA